MKVEPVVSYKSIKKREALPPVCILIDCHNPAEPLQCIHVGDLSILPCDPGTLIVKVNAHHVGRCFAHCVSGAVEVHIECVALRVDFGFFIQAGDPLDVVLKGGEVHLSGELRLSYRISGEPSPPQWPVPPLSQCGWGGSVPRASTAAGLQSSGAAW